MTAQAESSGSGGRFLAMVGMLVWRRSDGKYLLLKRSPSKDFAPGEWETGSGRLEQGEGFVEALRRESMEELALDVRLECILGVTHFYRGTPDPANEMVGVSFGCSVADESGLTLSEEHSEHAWLTAEEAVAFLPRDHWLGQLVARADTLRKLMPEELRQLHWTGDIEF